MIDKDTLSLSQFDLSHIEDALKCLREVLEFMTEDLYSAGDEAKRQLLNLDEVAETLQIDIKYSK